MEEEEIKIENDNSKETRSENPPKVLLSAAFGGLVVLILFGLVLANLGPIGQKISQIRVADLFNFFFTDRQAAQNVNNQTPLSYQPQFDLEQRVINVVKENSGAVVSVIQTKDVPILEQCYKSSSPFDEFLNDPFFKQFFGDNFSFQVPDVCQKGVERKEVGGGTGFIIASDGLIVTNKHVVADTNSEYTVLTNDGRKLKAEVLARDPFQDFALLKINTNGLTTVKLGDSDSVQVGQFVVAIGNALGEFRNTVSFGVVSGIRRNISASGPSGFQEILDEVIQTDAAINPGNSGGPLLNLKGEVIGINTAIAQGAQNISFTIPINKVKRSLKSFETSGKIVYPFLGVRYISITAEIQKERKLPVDYGALLVAGDSQPAIVKGSPAEKAGLKAGDIILEVNNQRISEQNTLSRLLQQYQPNETVHLKILRDNQEKIIDVVLSQKTS